MKQVAGNRITDSSALTQGEVWVLLKYVDGSEFCFKTTLNPTILASYGVVLQEGCLARLDKRYLEYGQMVYRQFPFRDATISLWDAETYTDEASAKLRYFL